ncbi:phosphatidylserine/phosphatidylglycerophosphate/cardiolipin synthase family protein [Conexibacter sp. SYSU D00693]|uniref:phospholipase D-like domain-containing protein n=1 Tax=Conexibacter sp. SYSU D00693 TaxID=2812560 RepID=UPI00196A8B7E|nr:phosphatidylserine/phosphatidylglycerophosphate/cardiolipin synthase family protein [Conexibacter sp. SYSU D00693]
MGPELLGRLDARIGDAVEAAVRLKHRRRLARLGWAHALDPPDDGPFCLGDPAPRDGCAVDVLIDGAQALPAIAQAIRGARRSVHLTGWHVAPGFELERGEPACSVGQLLAEAAERVDVRMLVWAGAPVPAFHPTRKEVEATVHDLVRGTRIRCERDPREHPFHCHHEKTVVVDGEVAFVGGIDLTDQAGDRFDSPGHPARRRLGWHDAAVRLRGPAVADVDAHFCLRWGEVTGERLEPCAPPPPAGSSTVQVVRTVAEDMYDGVPRGDFRILEAYVRALRSARRLVYLENQFLWSPELVAVLAEKLRRPPSDEFRVVVVLPAKANNGQDDTRGQLGVLVDADDGAGRFLAATVRGRSGGRTDPLYVHAKVCVVDDERLLLGSANLNAHSLLNDTEMDVVCDDPAVARDTRVRLWAEHLELDVDEVAAADPTALVDERWQPVAAAELRRQEAGEPARHRLVALPGVSRRSARLLGPLQGLVDDG